MKKSTRFDLFFASAIAASLLLFMSCGHQQKKDGDGLFADMDNGGEQSADSTEVNVPTADQPNREVSNDLAATTDQAAPKEAAPVDPLLLTDGAPITEKKAEPEVAPPSQLDTAPPVAEALPPMDSTQAAGDALAQMTLPTEGLAAPELTPAADTAAAPKKPRKKGSKAPAIPKESVWKKGHTLNRYYFVRPGDTAESVAQLIYGDTTRAQDLTAWNKGAWAVGALVLFESASNASDTEMKSFFEERDIASEAYTVKAGEKLTQIAESTYGDSKSWVEIAAFNQLTSTKVAEGTVINLFPSKIAVAEKKEETAEAKPADVADGAEKVEAVIAPQQPAPKEPEPETVVTKKVSPVRADLANPEVGGSFLEEHIAAVIGGLLILMASFFAFRYFRRSREYQD